MKKLIENYENRMKEYVLKMAEKPIILKRNNDKQMTSRQELHASSSNRILDKKGFIFTSYKSDKDRINEFIKSKEILEQYLFKNNNKKRKKSEFAKKLKQMSFVQPSMHFMKRTDIEKIYDILKKKNNLTTEQRQLYKQLQKLGFIPNNYEEYEYGDKNEDIFGIEALSSGGNYNSTNDIFNSNLNDEERYKKLLHNKIIDERKNMLIKRKLILNLGNKIQKISNNKKNKINEDEFRKTNFKALENLTMFKTFTVNHTLFKTWSTQDLAQQKDINESNKIFYQTLSSNFPKYKNRPKHYALTLKKKLSEGIIKNIQNIKIDDDNNIGINNVKENLKLKNYTTNNFNFNFTKYKDYLLKQRKSGFNLINDEKILKDLDITKEVMSSNPLMFKLNFNNNYKFNHNANNLKDKSLSLDKLKTLKKIAFEKNGEQKSQNTTSNNDGRTDTFVNDLKKEENILIDGKFYRKSDTDKIAEKMLKKCNWSHQKVNYKNMEGRGKLMFTNGLTVKEFEIKYGIRP